MAAVFVVFLVTGVALPALPLHVHDGLGLGAFAVGLVDGSQFAASLVSRVGPAPILTRAARKRAVIAGLVMASGRGARSIWASLQCRSAPLVSAAILMVGRGLLGGGESFVIVGSQSWGLALVGSKHTGKVMAWLGMAMYSAFAIGAPLGSVLFESPASRRSRSQRFSFLPHRSRRSRLWPRSRRSPTPASSLPGSPLQSRPQVWGSPSPVSASAA